MQLKWVVIPGGLSEVFTIWEQHPVSGISLSKGKQNDTTREIQNYAGDLDTRYRGQWGYSLGPKVRNMHTGAQDMEMGGAWACPLRCLGRISRCHYWVERMQRRVHVCAGLHTVEDCHDPVHGRGLA